MPGNLIHIVIALLVLVGLIFFAVTGLLSPVLDWGRITVNFLDLPLVKLLTGVKGFFTFFASLKDLASQNQILELQVEELSSQLALLEKAGTENKVLREALKFQSESRLNLIPAEIITYDPLSTNQKVILNRGTKHGVEAGDAVIVSGGIMVGVVRETLEHTSSIELVTSSSITVSAQTVPGGTTGIIRGEHGLGLTFDLVSQGEALAAGEKILTSGLGGNFPKNLLIGEIGEIKSASSELFQKASVIPAANFRGLRFVFAIKKP